MSIEKEALVKLKYSLSLCLDDKKYNSNIVEILYELMTNNIEVEIDYDAMLTVLTIPNDSYIYLYPENYIKIYSGCKEIIIADKTKFNIRKISLEDL